MDVSKSCYLASAVAVLVAAGLLTAPSPSYGADDPYMRVSNGQLVINGAPPALPSVNMFDLVHLYITDPAAGKAKLTRARQSGFKAVRFFAAGSYSESTTLFPAVELWENPSTTAGFFLAFDLLEQDATALGIKLIPALITGYSDPSERFRASGASCELAPFSLPMLPGSENRSTMIRFTQEVVARYKDSPTILLWEISNEANLNAKHRYPSQLCVTREQIAGYLAEVAGKIKAIDQNHLVAGGAMQEDNALPLGDVPGSFNDAADYFIHYTALPGIDIGTVHMYDQYSYRNAAGKLLSAAEFLHYFNEISIAIGRPLWIGEFGVPGDTGWSANNLNDTPMSILLAQHHLSIGLATAWNWESKQYGNPDYHFEMVQYSIDPGEDDDIIGVLTRAPVAMGKKDEAFSWTTMAADVNGDGKDDLLAASNRGTWQVSAGGDGPTAPAQWLSAFADADRDPGGAPFQRLTGDLNGDGKADVIAKSRDGRWFAALSNGQGFANPALWMSGFGDDNSDGGSPFIAFSGDWNGDGKSDIGVKSRDGRWYIALSNGSGFVAPRLALSGFADENLDPGGGGYTVLVGDWDGDGRSDIGVKSDDGRWFTASSNGQSFVNGREALSGFGNNGLDPAGNPFRTLVGDWNGDGKADIGVKSRDGRWYIALGDGTRFAGTRLAFTGFGNDLTDAGSPFTPFSGDWNGDGLTDIGVKSEDGRWYVAYADGTGFVYPRFWH